MSVRDSHWPILSDARHFPSETVAHCISLLRAAQEVEKRSYDPTDGVGRFT